MLTVCSSKDLLQVCRDLLYQKKKWVVQYYCGSTRKRKKLLDHSRSLSLPGGGHTCTLQVRSIEVDEKDSMLAWRMTSLSLSNSARHLTSNPFLLSQCMRIIILLSTARASISGTGPSSSSSMTSTSTLWSTPAGGTAAAVPCMPVLSAMATAKGFFELESERTRFFGICSSILLNFSCSVFTYLIASPSTEALSICDNQAIMLKP